MQTIIEKNIQHFSTEFIKAVKIDACISDIIHKFQLYFFNALIFVFFKILNLTVLLLYSCHYVI